MAKSQGRFLAELLGSDGKVEKAKSDAGIYAGANVTIAADGTLTTTTLPLAGGALTGAVTTNSTFDGRDVAADGVTADAALPKAGGTMTGDLITTGLTVDTTTLVVDKTNNRVGIGTSSPTSNLDVDSTAYVNTDSTQAFRFTYNGSPRAMISAYGGEGDFSLYRSSNAKNIYISSYYDSYFNGGNVGIGTDNPGARLHVYTTGYPSGKFERYGTSTATRGWTQIGHSALGYSGGTGADSYLVSQNGFGFAVNEGTTALVITDGGKVGIGHSLPDTELHVVGSGNSAQMPLIVGNEDHTDNSTSTTVSMGFGLSRDSGTVKNNAGLITVGKELAWTNADANIDSYMSFSTYLNNASDEKVRITSAGKVGIGEISPDLPLHVSGTVALPATSGSTPTGFISLRAKTAGGSHGLHMGVSNAPPWGSWLQAQDANNLATEYPLLLNPNGGNVGIGTSSPDGQLHVKGTTNKTLKLDSTFSSGTHTILAFARNGTDKWRVFQPSDDSYLSFYNDQASAHQLTLKSNGNVGIGVLIPTSALDVRETATSTVPLRLETNGGAANTVRPQISMFSGGTNGYHISTVRSNLSNDTYGLVFTENVTERMRIDSSGNVEVKGGNELRVYRGDNATYGSMKYLTGSGGLQFNDQNSDGISFVRAGSTESMRIDSSGVATFKGRVTTENHFSVVPPTTTDYAYMNYSNAGGNMYVGRERSNGGGLMAGSTAYAGIINVFGASPLEFATNGVKRLTITASGGVQFNGGIVKGARQTIHHVGSSNAITVAANNYSTVITTINVTTTGNSKLLVWAHSGQILKATDNSNPTLNINIAGNNTGGPDGNHYWYNSGGGSSNRVWLTEFGMSGTLAAGTHTINLLGGSYAASHVFNYQNQNSTLLIMEVGA